MQVIVLSILFTGLWDNVVKIHANHFWFGVTGLDISRGKLTL